MLGPDRLHTLVIFAVAAIAALAWAVWSVGRATTPRRRPPRVAPIAVATSPFGPERARPLPADRKAPNRPAPHCLPECSSRPKAPTAAAAATPAAKGPHLTPAQGRIS